MKKTILILTMLISMVGLQSYGSTDLELLEIEINKINAQCPVPVAMFGELKELKLDKNTNEIVSTYVNKDLQGNKFFSNLDFDLIKQLYLISYSNGGNNVFLQTLIDEGIGFNLTLECAVLNKSIGFTITPDEINKTIHTPMTDLERMKQQFGIHKAMVNSSCPQLLDPYTEMIELVEDGNYVIYVYQINENFPGHTIPEMKQSKETLRQNIVNNVINNSDFQTVCGLILGLNKGLILRHKGNQSGETLDIVFTNDDLKSYIKN